MIRNQLQSRGINDERILHAFESVKRHEFVALEQRKRSYQDCPLPIGFGQTISQPYIVALMTQMLSPSSTEKILEVGTGSGYQSAILCHLCEKVYSIEIIPELHHAAKKLLGRLGYKNIHFKLGDGFAGWPQKAPFHGIIVTCAPKDIPAPLIEQLAEGGRLVIPVGKFWQELKLIKKISGKLVQSDGLPVRFVPMTGKAEE